VHEGRIRLEGFRTFVALFISLICGAWMTRRISEKHPEKSEIHI
jgi:hypothetical protein